VCRHGAHTLFGSNPHSDLVRTFHQTCLHKLLRWSLALPSDQKVLIPALPEHSSNTAQRDYK
jgi:hypothetical protein